ncbi:MAG TPA: hypothetical protein PKI51_05300 [Anaerolineaceae bacterium]|nr:hypothetical protein [Anaerolineaceae bacterium]
MGTSLQQGIEAAKAGKLGLALEHLKNAVVEEPKNPEVWVWLAGIIDDEEKQRVFLNKALELDPDNVAAQRGIAYLQRQKYVPSQSSVTENKLATEKSPQSEDEPDLEYPDPNDLTMHVETFAKQVDAIGDPQAPSQAQIVRESKTLKTKPKRSIVDILIYGLTLIVFTIIGILIGATIKNRNIIPPEPTEQAQISPQSPGDGVFLSVNNVFYKMALGQNEPPADDGIPSIMARLPKIVVNNALLIPAKLKLLDENNNDISFTVEENPDTSFTISPTSGLAPGQYCLLHPISDENQAFYWCFKVLE